MPDPMKLLLILGAGASREFGKVEPMPLMEDWSNALCKELEAQEGGLSTGCRLEPEMSGQVFEKNLGLLLRWENVRHLEERFELLGGPTPTTRIGTVVEARSRTSERMAAVMKAVNTTLYDQFGQPQVDYGLAAEAYAELIEVIGHDVQLMVATTNYDRIAETSLEILEHKTNVGFERKPGLTPVLNPAGMVERQEREGIPVIHLHGAVGWYEKDGVVKDHLGDSPFNPTLGSPVVLYPDPEKDPTSDALVNQLWEEFRQAVDGADFILVIGHSLHDPALVRELERVQGSAPVIVGFHSDGGGEAISEKLPLAQGTRMSFGPIPVSDPPIGALIKDARSARKRASVRDT
jgi:hypothetical protein